MKISQALLLTIFIALAACGQKGPLVMPERDTTSDDEQQTSALNNEDEAEKTRHE